MAVESQELLSSCLATQRPATAALGVEIQHVSDPCGRDLIAASAALRYAGCLGFLVYLIHEVLGAGPAHRQRVVRSTSSPNLPFGGRR